MTNPETAATDEDIERYRRAYFNSGETIAPSLIARIDQDRAEIARLREAVENFLDKWDRVKPAITNAFALAQFHGVGPYRGPTLEIELVNLRAALAPPQDDDEVNPS